MPVENDAGSLEARGGTVRRWTPTCWISKGPAPFTLVQVALTTVMVRIEAKLTYHTRSVEVAACRRFLGEGFIVPIQFTSTAIISCVFASRPRTCADHNT